MYNEGAGAAVLLICLMLVGCCNPPVVSSQNVALRPQETGMWCWAASGEMIIEFLGTSVTQCDEANRRFGRNDCCNSPVPNACVNGGWPEFDKYGFNFQTTSNAPLTWQQIREEIHCRRRPWAITWAWTGGGGHMLVGTGYSTVDGVNFVDINDPWAPNVGDQYIRTYDQYVSGPGYTHWNDYYGVVRR